MALPTQKGAPPWQKKAEDWQAIAVWRQEPPLYPVATRGIA
jgi:hypothetical protein